MSGDPHAKSSIQRLAYKIKASIASIKFSEEPLILGASLMITLILILYAFGAFDTDGEIWNMTYGGPGFDMGTSIRETRDGGYVIAGATNSYGSGGYDAWLIRTKSKGSEEWNRTYGGSGDEEGMAIVETKEGGYAIAGGTDSYGAGDFDAWLIQVDSKGDERWNKTYGGSGYDWTYSIQKARDGGYVIVGETASRGAGGIDAWLIRADSNGAEIWNKTFGGAKDDGGRSIQETDDGYVIAGFTESYGAGGSDLWLIKVDSEGSEIWNVTFGGSKDDVGESVQLAKDGGYVIAGGANAPQNAKLQAGDAWLIRTDPNGTARWGRIFSFGDSSYDLATSADETKDGSHIIAGWSSDGSLNAWLIKVDSSGIKEWDMSFNESGREEGASVQVTEDGSYITTGWTVSSGNADLWLAKIGE